MSVVLMIFDCRSIILSLNQRAHTSINISLDDSFLYSTSKLFELNRQTFVFNKREPENDECIRTTNSLTRGIAKLGYKLQNNFEFHQKIISQKHFLSILHSLSHLEYIKFFNVTLDFECISKINDKTRFKISTLIFEK